MNEQIQKITGQVLDELVPETWVALGYDKIKEIQYRTAELIVRECARAVDKVYEDAEPDHGCYDWATWAEGSDVLKHFGVEE